MEHGITVLAGATGDLGGRIARALLRRSASVRAIVRRSSAPDRVEELRKQGIEVAEVDFDNHHELVRACSGGSCLVSALSGLRDVIIETQALLLDAAIEAGVPRFVPSDYSIDFTKLRPGTNRNLDLRRELHQRLDMAPIAAISILNGMFTELLTGQAPLILFKLKRVVTSRPRTTPPNIPQRRRSTGLSPGSCASPGISAAPVNWSTSQAT
jgi:hypothetical protein